MSSQLCFGTKMSQNITTESQKNIRKYIENLKSNLKENLNGS